MKLWELYIKEREGAEVLYDDHSFMTYQEFIISFGFTSYTQGNNVLYCYQEIDNGI